MKTYWENGGIAPFIIKPLHSTEVSGQLHTAALYPRGKISGTHWIGCWVGPRAGLDMVEKTKGPCPIRESNLGRPASSLVTILTPVCVLLPYLNIKIS